MKTTSKFLYPLLLLAAATVPQMATAQGGAAILTPAPTAAVPSTSSAVQEIEQRVLKAQLETAVKAAQETMEAAARSTNPEEQKRLVEKGRKYADWAASLNRQIAGEEDDSVDVVSGIAAIADDSDEADGSENKLNEIAWELLNAPAPEAGSQNAIIALRLAEVAAEKAKAQGSVPAELMDTLARARFTLGQKEQAIELQKKAVEATGEEAGQLQETLQKTLAAYLKGELPKPEPGEAEDNAADASGHADALNEIAWQMATADRVNAATAKNALVIAKAALELAGPEHDSRKQILDTVARATFLTGDKAQAIAMEQEAIKACGDDDAELKALFERTLDSYRKGALPPVGGVTTLGMMPSLPMPTAPTARTGSLGGFRNSQAIQARSTEIAARAAAAEARTADFAKARAIAEATAARGATSASSSATTITPGNLNAQAWELLKPGDKDGAIPALKLVHEAIAKTPASSAEYKHMLDTKARAMFILGEKDRAIDVEQEAIKACGEKDADLKALFERTVESYRKGELPPTE